MQCKVENENSSDANTSITTSTNTTTGTGMDVAVSAFRPIEFEIDTTSIPIQQCLLALFMDNCDDSYGVSGGGGSSGRRVVKIVDMMAVGQTGRMVNGATMNKVQACFRTYFILPDECPTSGDITTAGFGVVIRPPTQQQQQQK